MKVLKTIFFFIMGLIMMGCVGILLFALNPSLTAMLAEKVDRIDSAQAGQDGQSGGLGGLFQDKEEPADSQVPIESQPGINTDWLEGESGYEQPDIAPVEVPDSVSGKMGRNHGCQDGF